jgi:hypothetical protein
LFEHGTPTNQDWSLRMNSSATAWRLNIYGVVAVDFTYDPGTNPLSFICTQRGTKVSIWINGKERATTTATVNTHDATFKIGAGAFWSFWGAPIFFEGVANRAWSDSEKIAFSENPWQLFAPLPRRIFVGTTAGGATNLVVADALHAHAADNLTLTQQHVLTVADAAHAHTVDNLTLTQAHTLAIAEALHAHAADNVVLSVAGTLDVNDALHAHAADNIALTQAHVLAIAEALHAHTADNLTLSSTGTDLAIAEALHAHAADNLALTQLHILVINDALHAHLADALSLALPGGDSVVLHGRVLFVRGERRTLVIVAENRTLTVH